MHRAVDNHHARARALQRVPPGLRLHVRRGTLRHLAPRRPLTARCGDSLQLACEFLQSAMALLMPFQESKGETRAPASVHTKGLAAPLRPTPGFPYLAPCVLAAPSHSPNTA